MISETNVRRKALLWAWSVGVMWLIASILAMFVHLIVGILMLIGMPWATYKLFLLCVRDAAEDEANKRRAYVKHRRDLARQEMKLLDADLTVMDDANMYSGHLNTCRCRLCR